MLSQTKEGFLKPVIEDGDINKMDAEESCWSRIMTVTSGRSHVSNTHSLRGYQVSKDEAVASDDLSYGHSNITPEYGGRIDERMEFSILAAGVDLRRKV